MTAKLDTQRLGQAAAEFMETLERDHEDAALESFAVVAVVRVPGESHTTHRWCSWPEGGETVTRTLLPALTAAQHGVERG